MVHLRIVVPGSLSERAADLLEATDSVSSLAVLEGAARRPCGDLILCDVAREDASVVIGDLRELGVAERGSISIEEIDSHRGDSSRAAAGLPIEPLLRARSKDGERHRDS